MSNRKTKGRPITPKWNPSNPKFKNLCRGKHKPNTQNSNDSVTNTNTNTITSHSNINTHSQIQDDNNSTNKTPNRTPNKPPNKTPNSTNNTNNNNNNDNEKFGTLQSILQANNWDIDDEINVSTNSPNKKLRSYHQQYQGCEIVDCARLNEQFIQAQKVHRDSHCRCIEKFDAVIQTSFINGKHGRCAKYVCSHCEETLVKDTTHKVATIDGAKYNTLNIRYAIASAESRIRIRRLKTIQVLLGLPQTQNKTYYRCADLVDSEKQKQARQLCKKQRDAIKVSKQKCYTKEYVQRYPPDEQKLSDHDVAKSVLRLLSVGFDGSWQNKIYSRRSRNGCASMIGRHCKKVLAYETRCKNHNYSIHSASGNMEREMLASCMIKLYQEGLRVNKVAVDGDSKIRTTLQWLSSNCPQIKLPELKADIAHAKKKLPDNIYNGFRAKNIMNDAQIQCFTKKFCRLLIDRVFRYCFHAAEVTELEDCKAKIGRMIMHYFPSGKKHPQCKKYELTWCNTAHGKGANKSTCLGREYPTGRGLATKFEKYLFNEHLTDSVIEGLLLHGSTSLNESLNAIINWYADKKRHLGYKAYEGAVARGISQWNDPYFHLITELKKYHIPLLPSHERHLRNMKRAKEANKLAALSYETRKKAYEAKWLSIDKGSDYIGKQLKLRDTIGFII